MIHTDTYKINNHYFVVTWSDSGYIERDGIIYEEAHDPIELNRVYIEVDGPGDLQEDIDIDDSVSTTLKKQIRLAARYASI